MCYFLSLIGMKCKTTTKMLPEYSEGALDTETRELIDAHLLGCESCRSAYSKMETIYYSRNLEEYVSVDEYFYIRTRNRLFEPPKRIINVAAKISFASLAVACAVIGFYIGGIDNRETVGNTDKENLKLFVSNRFQSVQPDRIELDFTKHLNKK